MKGLILKEIQNLREVIDDCLDDVPVTVNNRVVDDFKGKYDHAYGRMQKSLASDFYMGQCLAYKEILSVLGVKV